MHAVRRRAQKDRGGGWGDEEIGDPKSARRAIEAEARAPDRTPIPPGTGFAVMAGAGVCREAVQALGSRRRVVGLGG